MTCSPVLSGEPLSYKKEGRDFRIYARSGEYVVECSASEAALSSRNKNIQDRRFRMEAIDLMGAYAALGRVIGAEDLRALPSGCVLIELASPPGGFDQEAATDAGLRVIAAQGLPGRFYPESAGLILAETVCAILGAND